MASKKKPAKKKPAKKKPAKKRVRTKVKVPIPRSAVRASTEWGGKPPRPKGGRPDSRLIHNWVKDAEYLNGFVTWQRQRDGGYDASVTFYGEAAFDRAENLASVIPGNAIVRFAEWFNKDSLIQAGIESTTLMGDNNAPENADVVASTWHGSRNFKEALANIVGRIDTGRVNEIIRLDIQWGAK